MHEATQLVIAGGKLSWELRPFGKPLLITWDFDSEPMSMKNRN